MAAARELFGELEFTTLQKEFLAAGDAVGETQYGELTQAALEKLAKAQLVAIALSAAVRLSEASQTEASAEAGAETEEEALGQGQLPHPSKGSLDGAPAEQSSLTGEPVAGDDGYAAKDAAGGRAPAGAGQQIALCMTEAESYTAELGGEYGARIAELLADAQGGEGGARCEVHAACAEREWSGTARGGARHDHAVLVSAGPDLQRAYAAGGGAAAAGAEARRVAGRGGRHDIAAGRGAARRGGSRAELERLYREIDLPLAFVLHGMEQAGVQLDSRVLAEMSAKLAGDVKRLEREIHQMAGMEFNVNSPKQLGEVLFNRMGLPRPFKSGKGKTVSTAQDVLEGLAAEHEIARRVLEFRQLSKLKSTYIDALPQLCRNGRLHTSFNQTVAATGRLSSTNPNLQNIPIRTELGREIRAAFVAAEGKLLVAADYSQIELRLLAHYSQDPLLLEAYRTGQDIHALTASEVFGVPPMLIDAEQRRRAKAVNFGIVYGLSPFGLAQQLGIEQKEAKRFIDAYFARYVGVRGFIDRTLEQARRDGFVRNLFGRKRPIPDLLSKNPNLRGFAERTAVNTPLQGTAADLIKVAMLRLDAELRGHGLAAKMLLQVHDELVLEAPVAEVETVKALVKECMEGAHELSVPLEVEVSVGGNWRDME